MRALYGGSTTAFYAATPLYRATHVDSIEFVKNAAYTHAKHRVLPDGISGAVKTAKEIRAAVRDATNDLAAGKELEGQTCWNCGAPPTAEPFQKCARCHVARYSSRECQVRHWKSGGHKHKCAELKARFAVVDRCAPPGSGGCPRNADFDRQVAGYVCDTDGSLAIFHQRLDACFAGTWWLYEPPTGVAYDADELRRTYRGPPVVMQTEQWCMSLVFSTLAEPEEPTVARYQERLGRAVGIRDDEVMPARTFLQKYLLFSVGGDVARRHFKAKVKKVMREKLRGDGEVSDEGGGSGGGGNGGGGGGGGMGGGGGDTAFGDEEEEANATAPPKGKKGREKGGGKKGRKKGGG